MVATVLIASRPGAVKWARYEIRPVPSYRSRNAPVGRGRVWWVMRTQPLAPTRRSMSSALPARFESGENLHPTLVAPRSRLRVKVGMGVLAALAELSPDDTHAPDATTIAASASARLRCRPWMPIVP